MMDAEAVAAKPLSPTHSKSNLPLSVATVKNVMNGFAAIAGKQVGAENLHAVVTAGKAGDDIACDELALGGAAVAGLHDMRYQDLDLDDVAAPGAGER